MRQGWDPSLERNAPAHRVTDDPREGKVLCAGCGVEVTHVQVEGKWYVRTLDGLPHPRGCV